VVGTNLKEDRKRSNSLPSLSTNFRALLLSLRLSRREQKAPTPPLDLPARASNLLSLPSTSSSVPTEYASVSALRSAEAVQWVAEYVLPTCIPLSRSLTILNTVCDSFASPPSCFPLSLLESRPNTRPQQRNGPSLPALPPLKMAPPSESPFPSPFPPSSDSSLQETGAGATAAFEGFRLTRRQRGSIQSSLRRWITAGGEEDEERVHACFGPQTLPRRFVSPPFRRTLHPSSAVFHLPLRLPLLPSTKGSPPPPPPPPLVPLLPLPLPPHPRCDGRR
jgi:hypothetical protein